MLLTAIRHPRTDVEKGLCYGQLDVPLANGWEKETLSAVKALTGNYDVITTSDLSRCQLPGELIQKVLYPNLDFQSTSNLRELSFGSWEGRNWNAIAPHESMYWTEDLDNECPPNGEYLHQLWNRVFSHLEGLLLGNYKHPLIVTHAGVIRSIHRFASSLSAVGSSIIPVPYLSSHTFIMKQEDLSLSMHSLSAN